MAKVNCCICNAEVGLLKQVQMGDKKFLCRECAEKSAKIFVPMNAREELYRQHIKELERGEVIYNALLKQKKPSDGFGSSDGLHIRCNEDYGLLWFDTQRGGVMMFGGTHLYNIYRFADLYEYEFVHGDGMIGGGKKEETYARVNFRGDYAVTDILMPMDLGEFNRMKKYFDQAFGLDVKGGFFHKERAQRAEMKKGIAAAISVTQGLKGMMEQNASKEQRATSVVEGVGSGIDTMRYGDRNQWIEKADRALAGF